MCISEPVRWWMVAIEVSLTMPLLIGLALVSEAEVDVDEDDDVDEDVDADEAVLVDDDAELLLPDDCSQTSSNDAGPCWYAGATSSTTRY